MAALDEAIDALNANIAELEAGIKTPAATYSARAAAGKAANDNTPAAPPGPPTGPIPPQPNPPTP